ncbi:hypothetical protein FB451DRAFT_1412926 [Mycena latifolia]|nr:hypothetical protein FB451DRAFT_1412926 [Mycena latifolia]
MQFTLVALLAVLTTGAAAAPARFARDDTDGVCDVKTCVLDLAPSVISCASAAAQLGADVFSDAGCVVAAAKEAVAFPPSCSGCAVQLGVADEVASAQSAVSGAASTAEGAVAGAAESAGNAISSGVSSIGSALGGLFGREQV